MSKKEMLSEAAQQNAIVLAAVGGLVASVVREVAGNDISSAIDGQSLTADLTQMLVNQEIVELLNKA